LRILSGKSYWEFRLTGDREHRKIRKGPKHSDLPYDQQALVHLAVILFHLKRHPNSLLPLSHD
jgi:hypothetical protein